MGRDTRVLNEGSRARVTPGGALLSPEIFLLGDGPVLRVHRRVRAHRAPSLQRPLPMTPCSPMRFGWGTLALASGMAMLAVAVLRPRRAWCFAAHLCVGVTLLALAVSFFRVGAISGGVCYTVLGIGDLRSLSAPARPAGRRRGGDLFGLLMGIIATLVGLLMLAVPRLFQQPLLRPVSLQLHGLRPGVSAGRRPARRGAARARGEAAVALAGPRPRRRHLPGLRAPHLAAAGVLDRGRHLRRRRRGDRLPALAAPPAGGARNRGPARPPLADPGDRDLAGAHPGDGGGDGPGGAAGRDPGDRDPESRGAFGRPERLGLHRAERRPDGHSGRFRRARADGRRRARPSCSTAPCGSTRISPRCARSPMEGRVRGSRRRHSPCRVPEVLALAATVGQEGRSQITPVRVGEPLVLPAGRAHPRRQQRPHRHAGGRLRRRSPGEPDRPAGIPCLAGGRPRPHARRGQRAAARRDAAAAAPPPGTGGSATASSGWRGRKAWPASPRSPA